MNHTRKSFLAALLGIPFIAKALTSSEPERKRLTHVGPRMVFGVCEEKPLRSPAGNQVRIRMRSGEFATVVCRSGRGVTQHYIEDKGTHWVPGFVIKGNAKV